jgi:hypothetical protein
MGHGRLHLHLYLEGRILRALGTQSSGSPGSSGSAEMEEERDGGGGKEGESASNPIPIVRGKVKKRGFNINMRVVIRWVGSRVFVFFCFVLFLLYRSFGISPFFSCGFPSLLSSNKPSNHPSFFRQIYRHPNSLNKGRWEHTRQWNAKHPNLYSRNTNKFNCSKQPPSSRLWRKTLHLSRRTAASGWTLLSGGRCRRMRDPDPEEGVRVRCAWAWASGGAACHWGMDRSGGGGIRRSSRGLCGARTYALQPVSSSVPNPSVWTEDA